MTTASAERAVRAYAMARAHLWPDEIVGASTAELVEDIGGAARLYRALSAYDERSAVNAGRILGRPREEITMGDVDRLCAVAFRLLSPAERAADYAELQALGLD